MNLYEINNETNALISIGEKKTKVIENDKIFTINESVMKIIEHSCSFFGSSYLGRHEGTKKLIGVSHKSPIIIEESNKIIYFPTTSPRLYNCSWLSLRHIKNYQRNNNNTLINFENGQQIEIDISFGSFDNQYLRATKLESILRKRMKIIE